MIVLGIDGGLNGGLALIESGERPRVIWAGDIPVMGEGAKKRVHVCGLMVLLQNYAICHAYIERAQAMADQGSSSGFNYGRAIGAIEATIEAMSIPLSIVEAMIWKRDHGLLKPAGISSLDWRKVVKENSRQRAILIFPESTFWPLKKDHGRAEAALIGEHGLRKLLSPVASPTPRVRTIRPKPQLDLLDAVNKAKQA